MPEFGMRRGGRGGGRGGRGGGGGRDEALDPESEQFRKLFIGGLSYETMEDGLKSHFEQWGEIVDCVVMKDPNTKRSRGFGFVTYKEAAMLDEAQKNRPHSIDGREVESKRAMPRAESGRSESQQSVKKMFIGGMKDDTNDDHIRDVFSQYGQIETIDIIKDKVTGKPKGFAFVTFDDYDTVDKCVLISRHELNGKKVDVKKAQAKDGSNRGGGGGGRGGGRGGRGGDWGGNQGYGGGGGYGGSGGYGGGYGSGGGGGYGGGSGYGGNNWGNQGGGYDNSYGGGYNQGGGGGNWGGDGGFGSGYGNSYGGGAMKGGGYSQRDQGPYGSGYGNQGGGGGYGGGSGYGGGYNRR